MFIFLIIMTGKLVSPVLFTEINCDRDAGSIIVPEKHQRLKRQSLKTSKIFKNDPNEGQKVLIISNQRL